MAEGESAAESSKPKINHRKDKPWDTDDIDHNSWHIEPFAKGHNKGGPLLEESSFATLFPKYRERYLKEAWGEVTRALESHGVGCTLDLVHGSMSVRTTRKTSDPYIVLKARDMIKLMARGVSVTQATRVLDDAIACDIIKISGLVRNKERFVKRRQRIIGPDGSTLKAIELLTGCYVLVQGSTVSVLGPFKSLKEVRRIVLDCMKNIHPIYRIKELMIRRELAKDPKLAAESWDRFLPQFRRRHLKTSEKTAKKNEKEKARAEKLAEIHGTTVEEERKKQQKEKMQKKIYTPFPPAQLPRKVDLQMESGEYFLKPKEREARELASRKQQQDETTQKRRAERMEAFVAPEEVHDATVEEKRKKRKSQHEEGDSERKKKKKKRHSEETVETSD